MGYYSISKGRIQTSGNSIKGSYTGFNGYYYKETKFKQGDIVDFKLEITTTKGVFHAALTDLEGNILEVLDNEDSAAIPSSGSYRIRIEGIEHEGNFTLSWVIR